MALQRKDISNFMRQMFTEARLIIDKAKFEHDCTKDLDVLFSTSSWGFREVLLVVVITRFIDPDFKASQEFYKYNPRPVYEGPIRNTLLEYSIPNRKSGPLNVAKAAQALNEEWAAQRRPAKAAQSVVHIINKIEAFSSQELHEFTVALHARFLKEADKIAQYDIKYNPIYDTVKLYVGLEELIEKALDAGNTPQKVMGLLLKNYFSSIGSSITITGYEDRASVTSTTSKKPGDIQEESSIEGVLKVYEVTMKPFNEDRMRDSFDTLARYKESSGKMLDEVIVLCREQDCPEEFKEDCNYYIGKADYNGVSYIFYDLFEWIFEQLLRLNKRGKEMFIQDLNEYVSLPDTSIKVKAKWQEIYSKLVSDQIDID